MHSAATSNSQSSRVQDAKLSKRTPIACVKCRHRKIRCIPVPPSNRCQTCIDRNFECIYLTVADEQTGQMNSRASSVSDYENASGGSTSPSTAYAGAIPQGAHSSPLMTNEISLVYSHPPPLHPSYQILPTDTSPFGRATPVNPYYHPQSEYPPHTSLYALSSSQPGPVAWYNPTHVNPTVHSESGTRYSGGNTGQSFYSNVPLTDFRADSHHGHPISSLPHYPEDRREGDSVQWPGSCHNGYNSDARRHWRQ
ncbi:hypothetical protein BDQ12DRAFT_188196 [Crucibulum laeve]|uniref:Zn(2)-C6 fungal-type domain-containing protein n=1 Tax=Crucibulum laeve TaxID=68775 RepID=A0A5C3MG64_9AGAR|nr:hypothetical protein BDQ12DRAFT_188196 [Crucibulum laeve]